MIESIAAYLSNVFKPHQVLLMFAFGYTVLFTYVRHEQPNTFDKYDGTDKFFLSFLIGIAAYYAITISLQIFGETHLLIHREPLKGFDNYASAALLITSSIAWMLRYMPWKDERNFHRASLTIALVLLSYFLLSPIILTGWNVIFLFQPLYWNFLGDALSTLIFPVMVLTLILGPLHSRWKRKSQKSLVDYTEENIWKKRAKKYKLPISVFVVFLVLVASGFIYIDQGPAKVTKGEYKVESYVVEGEIDHEEGTEYDYVLENREYDVNVTLGGLKWVPIYYRPLEYGSLPESEKANRPEVRFPQEITSNFSEEHSAIMLKFNELPENKTEGHLEGGTRIESLKNFSIDYEEAENGQSGRIIIDKRIGEDVWIENWLIEKEILGTGDSLDNATIIVESYVSGKPMDSFKANCDGRDCELDNVVGELQFGKYGSGIEFKGTNLDSGALRIIIKF